MWLICYLSTAHLTVQKPVSNATSRSNSNTSSMAYCVCDVSFTLSSFTPGRLPWGRGRIERSPAIGASCYLLTTATHLAGPLFPQNCVHMCGSAEVHMCSCVWTEDLYLYANACLEVHVCARDIGRVDVKIIKYLRENYKDYKVWRTEGRQLDIEHVAIWEKW